MMNIPDKDLNLRIGQAKMMISQAECKLETLEFEVIDVKRAIGFLKMVLHYLEVEESLRKGKGESNGV